MQDQQPVGVLPRHLRQVRVERVEDRPDAVHIHAKVDTDEAACPACQVVSRSVRERYRRRLADTPLGATPVWILLQVRRFNCLNAACSKRTFAEQVPELTVPRGRRSSPLRAMLRHISVALAGRAGARLAAKFAIPASRSTLLRLLRATPPTSPTVAPRVLGVDDFALRRGQVYATVLIDMDTHQPVDVLPDRTADTLAAWLREHPGAHIVCRDRAGAYADGVRIGAPDAIQVADRFHLWMNLGEAVLNTVITHRRHLAEPDPITPDPPPTAPAVPATPESDTEIRLVTRTRERYKAVQQLLADGCSRAEISRRLGLDIQTVRRFANATHVEDLLAGTRRDSVLDPFKPYLQQRYHDSHTDTATLLEEIRQRGYRGSIQTLRRYLRPSRPDKPLLPAARREHVGVGARRSA
ncbi:ISL3 family transposase [Phytohabitans kaempferiae]|uniref:ISL3 family transposase n=1 Tax=Phytohabitans kaempferiae TaxID=1620943 RepID=A0ABV6M775_9ACTN